MSARATTDWDAERYDRLSAPQEEWARAVLERLELAGEEAVLDAGCGSGRVTRLLLERLPTGAVIGVDGSRSMIDRARESLGADPRLTLIHCDLLELDGELLQRESGRRAVDAAFSNATFHWVADHPRLFTRLHSLLLPGGRLVAQCGGEGNVEEFVRAIESASAREPFAEHLAGWASPWNFAGPEETEGALRAAGFVDVRCWLEDRVVEFDDPRDFVAVSGLAAHHERLPEGLREPFTDAVIEGGDLRVLRYVRLNIDARRPHG